MNAPYAPSLENPNQEFNQFIGSLPPIGEQEFMNASISSMKKNNNNNNQGIQGYNIPKPKSQHIDQSLFDQNHKNLFTYKNNFKNTYINKINSLITEPNVSK